ncbi:SRPBCC domain-containing protein [uncultured Hoeflea sp.]|uniref:SRPBCC family protein n=1 Tax=uncultured Hoeflea sp. TaxID=538666 RepID=UPI002611E614|nr:SRPBCC domain-containing protein [uncultured Hoeflea sp.]
MSNATIEKSLILNASPETVWAYLTDKDKLGAWFYAAKVDLEPGQDYVLVDNPEAGSTDRKCWGTVLEMTPCTHLKYTFTINPLNGSLTTVTWKLEPVRGGTKLSLVHEGIEAAAGEAAMGLLFGLDSGWDRHLANLRASLAPDN